MKVKDLTQLGIIEDPDHPGQGIFLRDLDKPSEHMDNHALGAYAKQREAAGDSLSRQESLQRFFQGWALTIAHDRIGRGPHTGWGAFLGQHRLSRPTALRAEQLYIRARKLWGDRAEEEVAQRTLMELYVLLGILREKASGPETSNPNVTPEPRPEPGTGAEEVSEEDEPSEEESKEGESEEPDDTAQPDTADSTPQDDGGKPSEAEGLEAIENEEIRKLQEALRQQTPLSRAVAIRNGLYALVDDLTGETAGESDELHNIFDQIIELAEAGRGLVAHEQDAAL
jgi:hypothetical protein